MMGAWLRYAAVGLVVTTVCAAVTALALGRAATSAVVFAAVVAYVLQLIAFGALLALRDHATMFLAGWVGGMFLRAAGLILAGVWLSRTPLPRATAMLSLVGFLFLLLMLEPLFLPRGTRTV
jgi:hypothetical protein